VIEGLDLRRLTLLGALLALFVGGGALAGYLVREFFLTSYRASSAIFLDEVQSFRRADTELRSRAAVLRFARARSLQDDPAIKDYLDQLVTDSTRPVSMTVSYPVSRADYKELPETVAREMLKDQRIWPRLMVAFDDRDEREAERKQAIIVEYVVDTLLRSALMETLRVAFIDARSLSTELELSIARGRWKMESLARQIGQMDEIRDKYERATAGERGQRSGSDSETIQIPTSETRFLSPARQLIGLESERAQTIEDIRLATARRAYAAKTEQLCLETIKRADAEGDTRKILLSALAGLEEVRNTDSGNPTAGVGDARKSLREALSVLRGRYLDLSAAASSRAVYRVVGAKRSSIGGGILVGFLLWLSVVRLWRLTGPMPARRAEVAQDGSSSRA
jgi:hypothetical protein